MPTWATENWTVIVIRTAMDWPLSSVDELPLRHGLQGGSVEQWNQAQDAHPQPSRQQASDGDDSAPGDDLSVPAGG